MSTNTETTAGFLPTVDSLRVGDEVCSVGALNFETPRTLTLRLPDHNGALLCFADGSTLLVRLDEPVGLVPPF